MAFHTSSQYKSYGLVRNNAESVMIHLKTLIQVLNWNLASGNGMDYTQITDR